MFHLEDVLQLKTDERIHGIVRRHWATLIPSLGSAAGLIVLPFFFLFPLFALGLFGVCLFSVCVLGGVGIALRALWMWDADVFIVTSVRVVEVDQRGMFARGVSEASLESIQEVSWGRKGMWETLFRMGTLTIRTHSTQSPLLIHRIASPEVIADRINDLRRVAVESAHVSASSSGLPDRREKLQRISGLLETYPLEELERIELILQARVRTEAADVFLKQDVPPSA